MWHSAVVVVVVGLLGVVAVLVGALVAAGSSSDNASN